ncbi:hypothetical protein QFZ73_000432 [Peribacillus sp. V2I11]|nr:hypothetical protein [Peribacillus sp. V2I11]
MRRESSYALSNLDRIRWLIVSGWYMEMEEHVDVPYGVWTKIEGNRSKLDGKELSLLDMVSDTFYKNYGTRSYEANEIT